MITEIIWKDINGYEGYYQISDNGEVKSLRRKLKNHSRNVFYYSIEKILKISFDSNGYKIVNLYKNGAKKTLKIHRLLAIAFIPNPHNYPIINHKNSIKHDNSLDNLEWCTYHYNWHHAMDNNRIKPKSGEDHPNSIKVYQYELKTGKFIMSYSCATEAAKSIPKGIMTNISSACSGKYHSACNYKWSYEKHEIHPSIF